MPRTKLPPTPMSSTGPSPKDRAMHDMENSFALPSAALRASPPASPVMTRKRTLSGSAKIKDDLPPPPSRARKIIQMKPREEQPSVPSTPISGSTSVKSTTPNGRKKQPSATSAAGRKVARKTAHSIIERRRRSKMNEEFGVLKDMIPACKGSEMHKLAILQAGIEYVRYLQGCVERLQDRDDPAPLDVQHQLAHGEEDEEDEDMDRTEHTNMEQRTTPGASPHQRQYDQFRRASSATTATTATTSTSTSPRLHPRMSTNSTLANQRQLPPIPPSVKKYSVSPPPISSSSQQQQQQNQPSLPTGVSPAFNAMNFSPYENTTHHQQQQQHPSRSMSIGKLSPHILPLPHSGPISNLPPITRHGGTVSRSPDRQAGDVPAEVTATAALMMMGSDTRGRSAGSGRGGRMSVQDLLSH